MMKRIVWLAVAILSIAVCAEAAAQGMPRRDRSGSPRDSAKRDPDSSKAAPVAIGDPFAALERELPSLKTDLKLTADQGDVWNAFERDVREVAEMDRSRRKHIQSLREGGEHAPTALSIIATLAEDDRMKSEATADLKRHLEALYGKLSEDQRRLVDRRVVLSQTEPLGR
jgi:hypothetical protein